MLFSTRVGAVPIRIEPPEQLSACAAVDDAFPDPGESARVGNVGKIADQRVAGGSAELASCLSAQ